MSCYGRSRPLVRLTTVSPTEYLQQTVQEHCLAFQDLKSRLGNAKPGCAVELRKRLSTPRPRRPFHVEHVAPKIGWVPILFNCPHMDDLAARLLGTAKRNGFAARTVAGLFGELTLCGRRRRFTRPNQAFRDSPGTLILTAPKRAARVAKQDFNGFVPLTEKQETCALYFG